MNTQNLLETKEMENIIVLLEEVIKEIKEINLVPKKTSKRYEICLKKLIKAQKKLEETCMQYEDKDFNKRDKFRFKKPFLHDLDNEIDKVEKRIKESIQKGDRKTFDKLLKRLRILKYIKHRSEVEEEFDQMQKDYDNKAGHAPKRTDHVLVEKYQQILTKRSYKLSRQDIKIIELLNQRQRQEKGVDVSKLNSLKNFLGKNLIKKWGQEVKKENFKISPKSKKE